MGRRPIVDDALYAGARRAFAKYGFHEATLERIAEEAGVSRVTLHRRGITKQGLLEQLAERAAEQYRAAMWPALTASGSGADRLERALEILCEQAEANLDVLLALGAQANAEVFHEEGDEALTRAPFTEPLERLLRDGAADGTLREVDPVETATVLFNLVGWAYVHLRAEHRWAPERARRATLDVAVNGLRAAGSRR
ncbi:TetR/AcrR family transcriptional regulator [Thermoleophilum album]|uniref:Transcriptional regulator, TetR family n=1 Tax=Thermoleophilum album TaxID=29539 RepID=A0A1H6FZD1_THEAL|nr:TetR/AcrR family transcriptional regulator [Thermoleophilum album]SEH16157.1 transcriptional regulator, TetR family [Thermoleophilum album]